MKIGAQVDGTVYRVQVTEERAGEPTASSLQSPQTPSIAVI
jgi:hypothetical protein